MEKLVVKTTLEINGKEFIIPLISGFSTVKKDELKNKFGFYIYHGGCTSYLFFDDEDSAILYFDEVKEAVSKYWTSNLNLQTILSELAAIQMSALKESITSKEDHGLFGRKKNG
jgi:uncharacterized FlgJ-related protein